METKSKLKSWWEKTKGKKGLDIFLILLIVAVIAAIYASTYWTGAQQGQEEQQQKQEEVSTAESDALEQRLKSMLSRVQGAGEVEVMVNYAASAELSVAFNTQTQEEDSAQDGQGSSASRNVDSAVATVQQQGTEQPVVLREDAARIAGVLVVAAGASDPGVRMRLTDAVCTLLDVPASDVEVLTMG